MTLAVNIAQGASNNVTFRNRIINGACVIDQRKAGTVLSSNAAGSNFTVDRWEAYGEASGKFSMQQNAGSVTPPTGFTNYVGITSLGANTPATGDSYTLRQWVEGFNSADLGFGAAGASTVTLSFWVRSSLTGTFSGVLTNYNQNRAYPFTFTISSANTWEYKAVTIVGDTSGTWNTTNSGGIGVVFNLGCGATRLGTANAWATVSYVYGTTGSTNVLGTNGATFYITGVQLEAGTTASPFEYRQYGTELNLCQRYYQRQTGGGRHFIGGNGGVSGCFPTAYLLQTLRSAPSFSYSAVGDFVIEGLTGGGQSTCTSLSLNAYTFNSVTIQAISSSSTGGTGGQILGNSSSAWTAFSAEL